MKSWEMDEMGKTPRAWAFDPGVLECVQSMQSREISRNQRNSSQLGSSIGAAPRLHSAFHLGALKSVKSMKSHECSYICMSVFGSS